MSEKDIIIIVATLTFASTVGVYAAIRYIKLHTRPPMNTLVRSGDIELPDFIEPTHPQQIYNYPDLLESQYPIYDRISEYGRVPSYWSGTPPSYWSGTPPSYQTVDRFNIHCCLENVINLDSIFWLILICVFLLTIRKWIISNINTIITPIMIILLVLFLAIIYIQFGLLVLSKIIILFIIVILSNSLLGLNPYHMGLHAIKIMSIILIIFILYYNSRDILISTAFMTPLSISRISYIDDLDVPAFPDFESEKIEIFSEFTIKEFTDFLNKLEDNESYIVEIGFIPCIALWDPDAPLMLLSKPVLINGNSSPTTINKFILERLDYMVDYYYLDDTIIQKESESAVSLTYCKLKETF